VNVAIRERKESFNKKYMLDFFLSDVFIVINPLALYFYIIPLMAQSYTGKNPSERVFLPVFAEK
jgi:hypothetical protein